MENNQIKKEFDELLSFKSPKDELRHDAVMLSLKFISEINEVLQENSHISKKQLAEMLDKSPSYVTQLFNGDKKVNMDLLARFQKILNTKFAISTFEKENKCYRFSDFDEVKKFRQFDNDGFWVFHNTKTPYENGNVNLDAINLNDLKEAIL